MSKLILFLALIGQTSALFAENLTIEPKHANFEPAIASSTVSQSYTISNRGDQAVAIRDWKAISGAGEVLDLPANLAPGESRQFRVSLELPAQLGQSGFRYALFTDETDVERYRFTLSGFVFSVISPENAVIDLGKLQANSRARQALTLEAREAEPLKLVGLVETPDWIEAGLKNSTVSVGIRPDVSLGIKAGTIRIETNLAQQPFVEITAKAIIEGNLKPSTYVLGFKPTEIGRTIHAQMELLYSGEQNLDSLKFDFPGDWEVKRAKCSDVAGNPENCVRIQMEKTIKESGRSAGVLKFRMPNEPELEIPFGIMGLNPDQSVREILVTDDEQAVAPAKIDITRAIQEQRETPTGNPASEDAPAARKVSRAKGSGPVRLRWKAANDESVYGYMIYRADDRAGPYRRITAKPLPKQGDATAAISTGDQVFVDEDVEPGKTYYYYIDTMAKNGTQERLSPVLSKTVTP